MFLFGDYVVTDGKVWSVTVGRMWSVIVGRV